MKAIRVLLTGGGSDHYEDTNSTKFDFVVSGNGVLTITVKKRMSKVLSAEETTTDRVYSPHSWTMVYRDEATEPG